MDYKAMAHAYHAAVSSYDQAAVTKMVRQDYIQHNPKMPTGRGAFIGFLPKLREHGSKIVNVRMLSDGPYIVMHHVWKNADPFGWPEMAAFHIIRFDAEGLIAEHWNVMAEMTPCNLSGRSLVDGETEIRDRAKTAENKAIVTTLFRRLIQTGAAESPAVLTAFFESKFHQHHPAVADGVQGYKDAVESGSLRITYEKQHKIFGEGNFALSVSEGSRAGKPMAFYDLLRLEDGFICEHWNIYQEIPTEGLANDNTMFSFDA